MNIQNLSDIELLNLKKEDLQGLSKEKLNELLILAENKENLYNTQQLVEKLLINSLYGALANKYFSLFNEDMAAAITGNGRYFIQKLANYIENKLQSLLPSKKPYIIYGDTDSVIGSTLIKTENGDIKIEDIYENIKGNIEIRNEDNFIKHICEHIKAASVSKNKELEYNNINYIMKHKVKKRMYKIKCDNDEVIITEDHSMMVVRNNNLIEIKPKYVLKTDKLIKINTLLKEYNNFEIEDLGIQEEWVYDIEVEKNHNFFGNNILVHNSVYFHIEPFMEKYQEKNPDLSINEYVEWADNFEKKIIQPIIQQCIDDFSKQLNAYNKDSIGAEREIISDCLHPKSLLKIKQNNKIETLKISSLAKKYGINTLKKSNEFIDLSNEDIEILSYNEKTGVKELKKILNIQKKVSTKDFIELSIPNGKKLIVTEDHPIAIKINNEIHYKEAQYITEYDNVQIYDNTFYNKENCKIYDIEYINYGSKTCDLIEKGKNISLSKQKNFKITKQKRQIEFDNRIQYLLKKYSGKWFKFISIYCSLGSKRKNVYNTKFKRPEVLKFIESLKLPIDIEALKIFIKPLTNLNKRRMHLKKYSQKLKYHKRFMYNINNYAKNKKNGFKKC